MNWENAAEHGHGAFGNAVHGSRQGLISTNPARCRDCYRCVRTCPVKAVRVSGGQAEVIGDLCIGCANCLRACPQKAKVFRDDIRPLRQALAARRTVIATVAPSAAAYFAMNDLRQLEQVLRALGFTAAFETAFGAEMVGLAHRELLEPGRVASPLIASSCPVVVNLIEQYYPDLIPNLAPIVSPMIAHGRYLRAQYGPEAFIVFIGPCIAKKGEAVDEEVAGAIDAVLTFTELEQMLQQANVAFPTTISAGQVEPVSQNRAATVSRLFPLEGGLIGTARLDTDQLSGHSITGSGLGTCENTLEGIRSGAVEASIVELMACGGGCINGPALMDRQSVALSRQRVMAFAARREPHVLPSQAAWPALARTFHDRSIPLPEFSEAEIQAVLRQVDKYTPEDELNCGSCGYTSCREKAVATLRGMAEATMCIPYMRSRAESLNSVVMDATPNAILVVDRELRVQDISPSAGRMFNCNRLAVRGKPLTEIMPCAEDFVAARDSGVSVLNKIVTLSHLPGHKSRTLIVEETIVPVRGQNFMVAILRDVTEREQQRHELERIRAEALKRSQEVINKQMRVAHEIAGLLGETTAETKVLLTQLARLMDVSPQDKAGSK